MAPNFILSFFINLSKTTVFFYLPWEGKSSGFFLIPFIVFGFRFLLYVLHPRLEFSDLYFYIFLIHSFTFFSDDGPLLET